MKRFLALFFIGIITFSCFQVSSSEVYGLSAYSYVLYCPDSKEVILDKDENLKLPMASTTKIMTALLALEQAEINDLTVEFTEDMVAEGSSMYLKVGDKLLLSDLAAGMMAASGNDGANAVAYTLGGSIEGFAQLMNSKAQQLGMNNTNFTNPSGLPDDAHYSTAYDMALLMSAAMENESFARMNSQKSVTVDFIIPQGHQVTYGNHNRLLSLYDNCIGGKTGYTKEAGRCLVTCARDKGLTLVAVTLDDGNDWEDHISLYDYGFENFSAVTPDDKKYSVVVLGCDRATTVSPEDFSTAVVSNDEMNKIAPEVYCPSVVFPSVKKGERLGEIIYTNDGEVLLETELIAEEDIKPREYNCVYRFFKNLFYRIF